MSPRLQAPSTSNGVLISLVAAGTFLGASFGSMVTVALPSIGRSMDVAMDDVGWVVQIFLAVAAITLIPAGRLGDRMGHLRVYRVGLGILVVASALCALAGTFWLLLAGRALQGFGAGMLMSCGPALLTTSESTSRARQSEGPRGVGPPNASGSRDMARLLPVRAPHQQGADPRLLWTKVTVPGEEPAGRAFRRVASRQGSGSEQRRRESHVTKGRD